MTFPSSRVTYQEGQWPKKKKKKGRILGCATKNKSLFFSKEIVSPPLSLSYLMIHLTVSQMTRPKDQAPSGAISPFSYFL